MNGEAVYRRIASELRDEIDCGALAPGDPVPRVTELAEIYKVTRVTARHALRELIQEGKIVGGRVARHDRIPVHITRRGAGWAGEAPTAGADSWGAAVLAAGRVPSQRIEVLMVRPSADIAERFGFPLGESVIMRRLIRYVDGEPHNLITFWFPYNTTPAGAPLAAPESIAEGSIAWLETKLGSLEHRGQSHPRMPTPEESEILRIPPGVPVEEVWRTSSLDGRPVAVSRGINPGDRMELTW